MTPAPGAESGGTPPDPTAVVGRRVLAWVIDLVLYVVLAVGSSVAFGERHHGLSCSALTNGRGPSQCFAIGDTSYLVAGAAMVATTAISLVWFLGVFGVLQGRTGRSPGKAICGVRVIGADGRAPGMTASLVRSLCWAVDGFPFLLGPVVGGVAMVSTDGHRRLGDRAAQTWVVASGAPPTPPLFGPRS